MSTIKRQKYVRKECSYFFLISTPNNHIIYQPIRNWNIELRIVCLLYDIKLSF